MDIAALLDQTRLFTGLPPEVLADFARHVQRRVVHTGQALFSEGDPVAALYVVVTGRLRAYARQGSEERALGEIGARETLGEIAILADQRHTATTRAVRDSVLLRIAREDLLPLLARHPGALMQLSQVVVGRLLERLRRRDPGPPGPRSFAVIPGHPDAPHRSLAQQLRRALAVFGPTQRINAAEVDGRFGAGFAQTRFDDAEHNPQLMHWLNDLELQSSYVVYEADAEPCPWSRRCMRQADRILIAVSGDAGGPAATPMLRLLADTNVEAPIAVVLKLRQQPASNTDPLGWRAAAGAGTHYFARSGHPQDVDRLARQLIGRGLGLVLGGGGARGFAHLGLLQAIEDVGLPVDVIGGASMGAFIAGLYAEGRPVDEIVDVLRETFVRHNFLNDYTVPRVALIRARKFRRRLHEVFGDQRIEHLMLPYFCVSTSLTLGRTLIHDDGPLETWVATSMAVPGIAPPMVWHNQLLADGALTNGVPTDIMRALGRGPVIACDVSDSVALDAPGIEGPDPEAMFHWSARSARPNLFDILLRSSQLTSDAYTLARAAEADCYIRMPVGGVGLFDWRSLDQLMRTAYDHARTHLERFQAESRGSAGSPRAAA